MKVAYLHVLPLEYYPPARNTLEIFSRQQNWEVKAWSTANRRGHPEWSHPSVAVRRAWHAAPDSVLPLRLSGYASWHFLAAAEIAAWNPDVLMVVEPHSALAAWIYFRAFRGRARLFVHYHELYTPEDYAAPGMRILRATHKMEKEDILPRAEWISQTNDERLKLFLDDNPPIRKDVAHSLPNYPTLGWVQRAASLKRDHSTGRIRLIYVGSASLHDTFISEAAVWVAKNADRATLHVTGDNVAPEVWTYLQSLNAPNITLEKKGTSYDDLPSLLSEYDVGLVLYKGNTQNFVHNVPNKVFEYLAAGLEVWYPPQMEGMKSFHRQHSNIPLREIDYLGLPPAPPERIISRSDAAALQFTAESALSALIQTMVQQQSKR